GRCLTRAGVVRADWAQTPQRAPERICEAGYARPNWRMLTGIGECLWMLCWRNTGKSLKIGPGRQFLNLQRRRSTPRLFSRCWNVRPTRGRLGQGLFRSTTTTLTHAEREE